MKLDERVKRDNLGLPPHNGVANLRFKLACHALVFVQPCKLLSRWRCTEQPALQLAPVYPVMNKHGFNAPLQFLAVVFEAYEQHAATAKDMLPAKRPAKRQRNELHQSERAFANATGSEKR